MRDIRTCPQFFSKMNMIVFILLLLLSYTWLLLWTGKFMLARDSFSLLS